jgi:transcriptional regulator with XRE-family HTH domain
MDAEVQRLITILKTAMRVLGVTNREVERKLGMSPSYLTRVFSGGIELKAEHLIHIPRAIGLEPAEFFHLAYPKRNEPASRAALTLRETLQQLGTTPADEKPAETLNQDQLEKALLHTLRKMLGREEDEGAQSA